MPPKIKTTAALSGFLICAASTAAFANCDNGSLNGQYAFKAQGATVGIIDSAGALHAFASPQLINAVGTFTFDGNGAFTRTDFPMGNGLPQITPTTSVTDEGFRTGQTGTYSVDTDCTATITANIPGGTVLVFAAAIVDYGRSVFAVIKAEQVPGLPPAIVPAGTTCSSGCALGANVSVEMTQNTSRRR